jgi:RNA polymerase primary sigma factor
MGGDQAARDALVVGFRGLVYKIARDYLDRGVDLDDLVGYGNVGLVMAARRFDVSKCPIFTVHAKHWIKREIRLGIEEHRMVRVPRWAVTAAGRWHKEADRMASAEGHGPTQEEVRRSLRIAKRKKAGCILDAHRLLYGTRPESLDDIAAVPQDRTRFARGPQEGSRQESLVREDVLEAYRGLPEPDREIVGLRFGLDGRDPHRLSEIGRQFGYGESWAQHRTKKALRKIKELCS